MLKASLIIIVGLGILSCVFPLPVKINTKYSGVCCKIAELSGKKQVFDLLFLLNKQWETPLFIEYNCPAGVISLFVVYHTELNYLFML